MPTTPEPMLRIRLPRGSAKVWDRANVLRWMRAHGQGMPGIEPAQLAADAAEAFGVTALLAGWDVGEHWVWDLAEAVAGARVDAVASAGVDVGQAAVASA